MSLPHTSDCNGASHGNGDGHSHARGGFASLLVGCIGVVYGDIGTSPLYALRESLKLAHGGGVSRDETLGIVSLLLWALIVVVTLKYVLFLMRADNKGEGGTLSLMALAHSVAGKYANAVIMLGIVGAALFYSDAVLTPAISVLSAVEGLQLVTPIFKPYVLPITLVILCALFAAQSYGTGKVAAFFGPVTLLWFLAMGACAVPHLIADPEIFLAFSPHYGLQFLLAHKMIGFAVLGSVFLAVTGAEALYADMGHFGRKPIRVAWMYLVFPALTLNYLGQGALILRRPEALEHPFFLMAPSWALLPMVILATLATVIASQAVITGAYSLTRQAVQLGLLPRFEIRHTSATQAGQIYIPQVNFLLLLGVVILVLEFKNSSAIASAYGIAVSGTMFITTILSLLVVWKLWRNPFWVTAAIVVPFLAVDATFLAANLAKFADGGYIPVMIGLAIVVVMWTWMRGSRCLMEKARRASVSLDQLIDSLEVMRPAHVPGTAVFLTSEPRMAPAALVHNLKHNKVLHETNIIMTIQTEPVPRVPQSQRLAVEPLTERMQRVTLRFGFMETPNIPKALKRCEKNGLDFDLMSTSFFLGRRSLRVSSHTGLPLWQDRLYITLARNATDATEFFHIPKGLVVELGMQLAV